MQGSYPYYAEEIWKENGLGAEDHIEEGKIHDAYRIDYLRAHISAMKKAVEHGVDLIGYNSWGCIDLVSAPEGTMSNVYVDEEDQGKGCLRRIRKDSFYWYKNVIASNGENL